MCMPGALRGQKGTLELELPVVVSLWVMGFEPGSGRGRQEQLVRLSGP